MKIVFIINPVSGTGKQKNIDKIIEGFSNRYEIPVELKYTTHAGHATQLAKEYLEKDVQRLAIVGGDGSVNELAKTLCGTKACLAIVPTGSGNGLARHLKIPLNIKQAVDRVFSGHPKEMDIGQLEDHLFLSTAGFGFDAHVAHLFAHQKKRGFATYIKTVRKELFKYKPFEFSLEMNGEKISEKAFMLSAANIPQFGNNFTINPMANECDGLLNFTLIKPFPSYKIPGMVNKFFRGSIHRSKYFSDYKAERFSIDLPHQYAHVDGEPILLKDQKVDISIKSKALKVIV